MCADVLNEPTLVLNKSWLPISILRVKDSFCKVFGGMAKFIDDDFAQYSWEEWINSDKNQQGKESEFVHTPKYKVKAPKLIRLLYYNRMPKTDVKLTRRNILIRDGFLCQYCNKKLNMKNATMDHVIPRSKGGQTSWQNIVACCSSCNVKKGHKTLEEAKIKLFKKPRKPEWSPIYSKFVNDVPELWTKFVKNKNADCIKEADLESDRDL